VWVVDSGDRLRMADCRRELHGLLQEDVCVCVRWVDFVWFIRGFFFLQRLAGASLLVFANKQDIQGSMKEHEIRDVSCYSVFFSC
jgi:ADP-ribosylation factor-like protein 2